MQVSFDGVQPLASYMHGAVTSNDLMVIVGGIGATGDTVSQLSLYQFDCHRWTADITRLMPGELSSVNHRSLH